MRYGVISYDVPVTRQSAYNKLRKAMRETAIMQTWSCYFFPWAERDMLARVIEDLNADNKDKISFNILKFDESEEDKLAQLVVDGIRKVMANARDTMIKRLLEAQEQIDKGEAQLIDLKQAIGYSHREAKKAIKEAAALAIRFEQSGNLNDAIASYAKTIEAIVAEKQENYAKLAKEENDRANAKVEATKVEAEAVVQV